MGVAVGGAVGAVVEWLAEVSLSSHLFLSPLCATGAPVSLFLHLESVCKKSDTQSYGVLSKLLIHHNCTYGQFILHWASNLALPVLFPGMQAEPVLFLLATILYLESLKMNHLRLGMIESEELFCIQVKKINVMTQHKY